MNSLRTHKTSAVNCKRLATSAEAVEEAKLPCENRPGDFSTDEGSSVHECDGVFIFGS